MRNKIIKYAGYSLLSIVMACSSTPPSKTLPQSEVAVASINHANYRNFANEDVKAVESKLQHAKNAAANKDHALSEILAQQILVDVELLKLKTQRLSAEQDVINLESEISNLHQEIQWREPVQLSPLEQ